MSEIKDYTQEKVDDGRDDLVFGFDIEGKKVEACTVHQEFLDAVGIPVEKRQEVSQALAQMFIGMMKPFMELTDGGKEDK